MANTKKKVFTNPVFLAFEADVLDAFAFLEEYGFQLVDRADFKRDMGLRFASETVSLAVHYEYLNYVWVVVTYLKAARSKSYRLGDLLTYNDIPLPKNLGQVSSEEDVKIQIDLAANLLKQVGDTILKGNIAEIDALKQAYSERIKAEKAARVAAKAK